jgi:hypothetical protein
MSEWWTYRLSDFLLFSPRTYYRLFELYNEAIWPGQVLAAAAGLATLALLLRPTAWSGRIVAAVLAACWLWVAWAFLFTRYATINWAAPAFAAVFAFEALLLALAGVIGGRLKFAAAGRGLRRVGVAVFVLALILLPLLGPLYGRPWSQVELFGIAPDPTAIGTIGVLLAADRIRPTLLVIPFAWCAVTGATLWTMGAPAVWIVIAVAGVTLSAPIWRCWSSWRFARLDSHGEQ